MPASVDEQELCNTLDRNYQDDIYCVHSLLAKRQRIQSHAHNVIKEWEFLVWWDNFPVETATWELRFECMAIF